MTILLDTNALVWILDGGSKLSQESKELLENAGAVFASAINIVELQIKSMLDKIEISESILEDIKDAGIEMLPFSDQHAAALREFPQLSHHDPFDRMLLAQSFCENMHLLTSDQMLIDLKQKIIISTRFKT